MNSREAKEMTEFGMLHQMKVFHIQLGQMKVGK